MWYIAFTLGLFGSLHCVGMCGPLALAFGIKEKNNKNQNILTSLSYNLGRTLTYCFLGLLFGLFSSFLFIANLQNIVSISLGILLIISFLLKIDIDKFINQHSLISQYYNSVRNLISNMISKSQAHSPFHLGMANGLLPCSLVYLALAGALASGSILGGVMFMFMFGIGTIPMMVALSIGYSFISLNLKLQFRKILPYVSLSLGAFLIYRGIIVNMPIELNFWEAIRNPIMCH